MQWYSVVLPECVVLKSLILCILNILRKNMNWILFVYCVATLLLSIHFSGVYMFRCRTNILVIRYLYDSSVCDGINDCNDGSDEEITACIEYGKRPPDCHCRDVKDCNVHNNGYCKECLDHYYGTTCEHYSDKACHCMPKFDCKFNEPCVCEDSTWMGLRCELPRSTPPQEFHKESGISSGVVAGIVIIVLVFFSLVIALPICIYRKRKKALNNQRSTTQQRQNLRQVNILVFSPQSPADETTPGTWYTNRALQSTPEVHRNVASSEQPPPYDSLNFPEEHFSYPVEIDRNPSNIGGRLVLHQGYTNTGAQLDSDLMPIDSLRK